MSLPHLQPKSKKQYFLLMGLLLLGGAGMIWGIFKFRPLAEGAGAEEKVAILYKQKKYPEAIAAGKTALILMGKAHGADSRRLLPTLDTLVASHLQIKEHAGAQPYSDRALAIREKYLAESGGEDPIHLLPSLNQRAEISIAQGKFDEAEPYCRRAVELGNRATGKIPLAMENSLLFLGRVLAGQGKHADAEPLLRRALLMRELSHGDEHLKLVPILEALIETCRKTGKEPESKKLEERIESIKSPK